MNESPVFKEENFWQKSLADLLTSLKATSEGLSSSEAACRLISVGSNTFRQKRKYAHFFLFLSKFKNPLIIILLLASALSAFIGENTNFLLISTIISLSVVMDFVQEYRAGEETEKLRQLVNIHVQALRDHRFQDILLASLVPGDIILLVAGDLVPADGRILEANDFFVNQALLTGEPYPVEKKCCELQTETEILSAVNTVLRGTSVISGSAKVLICETGSKTILGCVSEDFISQPPPTSFEKGIREFGMLIMRLTIVLVLFVLLVNVYYHRPWLESFIFALALAVGLTPELLPMIISITLARGAQRMSAQKVIVKQLASIQNLGSMNVLCTDKTGTLTEAKIHLEQSISPMGHENERVLKLAYLNSYFETGLKSPLDEAILENGNQNVTSWHKVDEVPFDFERRRISVLIDDGQKRILVVKGAPEDIFSLCTTYEGLQETDRLPLDETARLSLKNTFDSLGKKGLRVLAIAWREVECTHTHAVVNDETQLIFSGFITFLDPPKQSAKMVLADLNKNGVSVKVITGDNEMVTQYIFEKLELPILGVLTGADLLKMDDASLLERIDHINLFCRMTPMQKNRIILALKMRGHTVGYLGDGINDALSLHSADVGISVDTAVDVAKESADMILLEHDLGVLTKGIMEGRRTFSNIMKYIMMGTSSNFGNMFSMAGASLFLPFLPMLPTQILLNNILYDLSEIPIPMDHVDEESLVSPKQWNIHFIRKFMLIIGPISSIFDFLTFFVMIYIFRAQESLFHTGWFIESLATQVLVIFVIRTSKNPLKSYPHPWLICCSLLVVLVGGTLPFTSLGKHLGFVPPSLLFFSILFAIACTYLCVVEIVKQWFYKHHNLR